MKQIKEVYMDDVLIVWRNSKNNYSGRHIRNKPFGVVLIDELPFILNKDKYGKFIENYGGFVVGKLFIYAIFILVTIFCSLLSIYFSSILSFIIALFSFICFMIMKFFDHKLTKGLLEGKISEEIGHKFVVKMS